jgi:glutathione peroxidase
MKFIKQASILCLFFLPVSFYTLSVSTVQNTIFTMSSCQGKKVLLVNVASNSVHTEQLRELEKFYQKHKDSVMVIVFPTNSFGKEPLNNGQLKLFFNSDIKAGFTVANKSDVTGAAANPVYKWMATVSDNEEISYAPKKDFEKVLISKTGAIAGIFAPEVRPLDDKITKALKRNF